MKRGERIYYSPAEFEILMEFSEGARYSICRACAPPEDVELISALASLYQRGLLIRHGDGFQAKDADFKEIRCSPIITLVHGSGEYGNALTAACYTGRGDSVWVAELAGDMLEERYRLSLLDQSELPQWLSESGFLEPPDLTEEDVQELRQLYPDALGNPSDAPLTTLEQYRNGGEVLCVWEILPGSGVRVIREKRANQVKEDFYTRETLANMMMAAFRSGG